MTHRAGLGSRVFAQVGHIDNLPFADATFELVVLIGVSEWLASLTQPLREIFRVLKPGGHLIISADNNWPLHQILDPVIQSRPETHQEAYRGNYCDLPDDELFGLGFMPIH